MCPWRFLTEVVTRSITEAFTRCPRDKLVESSTPRKAVRPKPMVRTFQGHSATVTSHPPLEPIWLYDRGLLGEGRLPPSRPPVQSSPHFPSRLLVLSSAGLQMTLTVTSETTPSYRGPHVSWGHSPHLLLRELSFLLQTFIGHLRVTRMKPS